MKTNIVDNTTPRNFRKMELKNGDAFRFREVGTKEWVYRKIVRDGNSNLITINLKSMTIVYRDFKTIQEINDYYLDRKYEVELIHEIDLAVKVVEVVQ